MKNAYRAPRKCKEISRYARSDTLHTRWSCIRAALCALCTRMHKEQADEATSEATKRWFSVYGVVLRRFVESPGATLQTERGEEKKARQQGFQTDDFEFQTLYRIRRRSPTRYSDSRSRWLCCNNSKSASSLEPQFAVKIQLAIRILRVSQCEEDIFHLKISMKWKFILFCIKKCKWNTHEKILK